jgi:hypothetical protein
VARVAEGRADLVLDLGEDALGVHRDPTPLPVEEHVGMLEITVEEARLPL